MGTINKDKVLMINLSSSESDKKAQPFATAAKKNDIELIEVNPNGHSKVKDVSDKILVNWNEFYKINELIDKLKPNLVFTVNSRLTPVLGKILENNKYVERIKTYSEPSAQALTFKNIYPNIFNNKILKVPTTWTVKNQCDWNSIPKDIPLVLKPSFSSGSIDTFFFNSLSELKANLINGIPSKHLNRNIYNLEVENKQNHFFGEYILQEKIKYKRQVGIEFCVIDKKVHNIFASEILTKNTSQLPFAHYGPIEIPEIIISEFSKFIKSLEIYNAHLSPDFLEDENGNWYFIDGNLNIGGEGLIDALKELGLDYPEQSLLGFLGRPCSFKYKKNPIMSFTDSSFLENPNYQIASGKDALDVYNLNKINN